MSVGTAYEAMNGGMISQHESQFLDIQTGLRQYPYKCIVCGKGLISHQSLSEHMMMHTDESPHRCGVCGKGFTRAPKLSEHMMLHTGERPYKCNVCGKGFIRRFRLTEHMTTHTGNMPFECAVCGKGYAAKYRLVEHARHHTPKAARQTSKKKPLQENVGSCERETMSAVMAGRNKIDVMIDLTEGEVSDADVPDDDSWQDFEQVDPEPEGAETSNSRTQTATINKGLRIGLGELLKCSLCKAEFSSKDDLYDHMLEHSQDFPFKCALCEERYASPEELSKHMPVHASTTYHTCDVCDEKFTRKSDLRKHKTEAHAAANTQGQPQSSTAVGPLSAASSPNDMTAPTAEVIYECIVCGEGYTDKADLTAHVTEHHEGLGLDSVLLNEINDDRDISRNIPQEHIPVIDVTRTNGEEHLLTVTPSVTTDHIIDLTDEVPDGSDDLGEGCTNQSAVQHNSTVHVIEPCESTSEDEEDLNQTSNTSRVNYQQLNISDTSSSGMSDFSEDFMNEAPPTEKPPTPTPIERGSPNNFALNSSLSDMSDLPEGSVTHPKESNASENNHNTSADVSVLIDGGRDNGVGFPQDDLGDVIDLTDDPPFTVQELTDPRDEAMLQGMHAEYQSQVARLAMNMHPQKCPQKCSVCGKECASLRSLSEHMVLHTHDSPYRCTYCRKVFTRKQKLVSHLMLHTGERPYSCTMCGKGFIKKHRLQEHITTHSGKLPFECAECHKGFTTNYKLTEHARIHTGEKPYECSICGATYRVKAGLNEHIFTHGVEKPYPCGTCDKSFTNRKALYYHNIARHSRIRPFKCSICSKGFVRNSELKKHMSVPC